MNTFSFHLWFGWKKAFLSMISNFFTVFFFYNVLSKPLNYPSVYPSGEDQLLWILLIPLLSIDIWEWTTLEVTSLSVSWHDWCLGSGRWQKNFIKKCIVFSFSNATILSLNQWGKSAEKEQGKCHVSQILLPCYTVILIRQKHSSFYH